MSKLNKELYVQHAKRLQFILNDRSPFAGYVKRNDFAFVLKTQLNVLSVLEKKFLKSGVENKFKVDTLVKKFNSLSKSDFKIDKNFKLEDDSDYIDNMNYLVTFCKNIFKVDIDDAIEGKHVNVAEPKVQLRSEEPTNNNVPFGMNPGMSMGAEFMDPRQNPFVFGQASAQLQKEISSGQFYRFNSKPKAIPIIKWVAVILILLSCIGLVLMAICAFLTHGITVKTEDDKGPLGTITDGIFFILFAGLGIYSCVSFFKTIFSKNPNDRFYFAWPLLLILIIGTIMSELFSLTRVFPLSFTYLEEESTALQVFGKNAWRYCWFINIALTCASIVPIVLGSIFNPKVDSGAIDKRLSQIIDSLSSSSYGFPKKTPDSNKDSGKDKKK